MTDHQGSLSDRRREPQRSLQLLVERRSRFPVSSLFYGRIEGNTANWAASRAPGASGSWRVGMDEEPDAKAARHRGRQSMLRTSHTT